MLLYFSITSQMKDNSNSLTPDIFISNMCYTPPVVYLIDIYDALRYVLLGAERTYHAVGGFGQSHGGMQRMVRVLPGGRHADPRNTGKLFGVCAEDKRKGRACH